MKKVLISIAAVVALSCSNDDKATDERCNDESAKPTVSLTCSEPMIGVLIPIPIIEVTIQSSNVDTLTLLSINGPLYQEPNTSETFSWALSNVSGDTTLTLIGTNQCGTVSDSCSF